MKEGKNHLMDMRVANYASIFTSIVKVKMNFSVNIISINSNIGSNVGHVPWYMKGFHSKGTQFHRSSLHSWTQCLFHHDLEPRLQMIIGDVSIPISENNVLWWLNDYTANCICSFMISHHYRFWKHCLCSWVQYAFKLSSTSQSSKLIRV